MTSSRDVDLFARGTLVEEVQSDDHEESELLSRIQVGEPAAYEFLVERHGGRMLAVAHRFLRTEHDCHDAVQDAFLSAFRSVGSFEGNSTLGTWLHRIVVNACLMKLRSQARRPTVSIDELLPAFDETGHHVRAVASWSEPPPERLAGEELRNQVRECINRLPETHRAVIQLRDIEEFDTLETATLLGISTDAVKTRLHRARQALRTLLDPVFAV